MMLADRQTVQKRTGSIYKMGDGSTYCRKHRWITVYDFLDMVWISWAADRVRLSIERRERLGGTTVEHPFRGTLSESRIGGHIET